MIRAILISTLVLGAIGTAWAAPRIIDQPEGAIELSFGDVRMPTSTAGSVIFKTCQQCESKSLLVNRDTGYFANGTALQFPQFLEIVQELRQSRSARQGVFVGVFYNLESKRVTRITLQDLRD